MQRLINALRFSGMGLAAAWKSEEAFRQEVVLALILIPAALWLGDNAIERILLIGSVLLVLVFELLNSAIEAIVDRIGLEIHPHSKRAKDMGSAAVLFALIGVIVTWGILLA